MPRGMNRNRSQREEESENDDDIEQTQPTQKRSRLSMPSQSQSQGASGSRSSQQRKGKERASGSQSRLLADSSDESSDDDEDDPSDELLAEPPTKDEIKDKTRMTALNSRLSKPKLNVHITDYESALGKTANVLEYLNDAALAVEELYEEGETDLIGELDQSVRDVIDAQHELDMRQKILRGIVTKLDQNLPVMNPVQIYQDTLKTVMGRYQAKTSRQKYVKTEAYQKFRSIIWEVHNSGTAMPSLNEHVPAEPGDEADDDVEDFEQGGVAQNFKCPLTTAILVDPVSSKEAIDSYIASKTRERRPATCPQAGCNAVLTRDALKQDAGLAKRVAIYLRRQHTQQQTQGTQAGHVGGSSGSAAASGSGSGSGSGAGRRGAAAAKEEAREDAIEEMEEGSDVEEEIELD
ncbi:hypothetical protein OC835_002405 [Tilletia horrida]|nr:hypothetical protein OC835_002405 [Tilletia horrida]